MLKLISFLLLLAAVSSHAVTPEEAEVWKLEKAYWEYVKSNELEKYRSLWHEAFLGWPSVSPLPVGKGHITDWITAHTSKGQRFESYAIERLAIVVNGDVAIDHYRIETRWTTADKAKAESSTNRITHTWIRTNGTWQILGGMSAPVNAEGK